MKKKKNNRKHKQSPYSCRTCEFGERITLDAHKIPGTTDPYPIVYACSKLHGEWIPSEPEYSVNRNGCASHSDFVIPSKASYEMNAEEARDKIVSIYTHLPLKERKKLYAFLQPLDILEAWLRHELGEPDCKPCDSTLMELIGELRDNPSKVIKRGRKEGWLAI